METFGRTVLGLLLALTTGVRSAAAQTCAKFLSSTTPSFDLAPLKGLVELCSLDAELCRNVTREFPASIHTLGYFVPAEELPAARARREIRAFTQLLIVQRSDDMTPHDLAGFRAAVRSMNTGGARDAEVRQQLEGSGRAYLGIVEETANTLLFVAIVRTQGVGGVPLDRVGVNTLMVLRGTLLSTYHYRPYISKASTDSALATARAWASCIARANR